MTPPLYSLPAPYEVVGGFDKFSMHQLPSTLKEGAAAQNASNHMGGKRRTGKRRTGKGGGNIPIPHIPLTMYPGSPSGGAVTSNILKLQVASSTSASGDKLT